MIFEVIMHFTVYSSSDTSFALLTALFAPCAKLIQVCCICGISVNTLVAMDAQNAAVCGVPLKGILHS